jgi:HEAT repeat protein
MKYIVFIVSFSVLLGAGGMIAQTTDGRTTSAVVAEVLARLPAAEPQAYEQLMRQLGDTGDEGLKVLTGMMNAPGEDDHSVVEYALNGLANFASGDETMKNKIEQAFIATLDATNETDAKAFIIRQLAIVGSDAAISSLAGYLTDEKLCSPAAGALVSIGGGTAGTVLQMALMRRVALSPEVQRQIIQALGDIRQPVAGTEEILQTMMNTNDLTTKGVVLKALSRTGTKQSLGILASAAASTGYKAENTDANGAYIQIIKRVYEQGGQKEALAAAQTLLKNATQANALPMRIAALEILFYNPGSTLKRLQSALKDGDRKYRTAALKFASAYADQVLYTELLKSLPKAKTDVKIDILHWIGNEAQYSEKKDIIKKTETGIEKTGIQTLAQMLNDPNDEVRQAAIVALGAIGSKQALTALMELFRLKEIRTLSTVSNVLSSFPDDITPALASVVGRASDEGKVHILELLSGRKANAYFTLALEQTKSNAPDVKNTAFKVLKDVVSEKDFIILCGMLETAEPATIAPLQQAIISSIVSLPPEKQIEMINNRVLQVGDAKKYLYDPVLSAIDDAIKKIK